MQRYRGVCRAIELAENAQAPGLVQLFRTGTFHHDQYGELTITAAMLGSMLKNFKKNIRGLDLAIDFAHENYYDAAAWIKDLELKEDATELWAQVEWTPKGKETIANKSYRYLSPEFTTDYEDNETLEKFGPTLLGAGLTNRPTIKNMEPVAQLQEGKLPKDRKKLGSDEKSGDSKSTKNKGVKLMDYKAMDPASLEKMSPEELKAMVLELMKKIDELSGGAAAAEKKAEEAEAMCAEFKKEKALIEKRESFTRLMTEGRAVKAQEEAYLSGDMVKFAELAQPLKLNEEGSGENPADKPAKDKTEAEVKVLALSQEKLKNKQAKDLGEAMSLVLKENKALHDLIYA